MLTIPVVHDELQPPPSPASGRPRLALRDRNTPLKRDAKKLGIASPDKPAAFQTLDIEADVVAMAELARVRMPGTSENEEECLDFPAPSMHQLVELDLPQLAPGTAGTAITATDTGESELSASEEVGDAASADARWLSRNWVGEEVDSAPQACQTQTEEGQLFEMNKPPSHSFPTEEANCEREIKVNEGNLIMWEDVVETEVGEELTLVQGPAVSLLERLDEPSHAFEEIKQAVVYESRGTSPIRDAPGALADAALRTRDEVVRELWQTVQTLEEERNYLSEKIGELMTALVNTQEDAAQYREEYDRIQAEGQRLHTTYACKCERLKQLGAELERLRADAEASTAGHQAEKVQLCGVIETERAQAESMARRMGEMARGTEELQAQLSSLQAQLALVPTPPDLSEMGTQMSPPTAVRHHASSEGGSMLSPDSLARKLEAAAITNELLRSEMERQARQAAQAASEAAAREEVLQRLESEGRGELTRQRLEAAEAAQEAEEQLEEARANAAHLHGHLQAVVVEADLARAQIEQMEGVVRKAEDAVARVEEERAGKEAAEEACRAAQRAQEEMGSLLKQMEGDMSIMYRRHKEEIHEITERYESTKAHVDLLSERSVVVETEQGVAWEQRIQELSEELEASRAALSELEIASREQIAARDAEIAEMEMELFELRERTEELREEVQELRASREGGKVEREVSVVLEALIGKVETEASAQESSQQVGRLKEELQRMQAYARELADFHAIEKEAEGQAHEENKQLRQQVVDGTTELSHLERRLAQLAIGTAQMLHDLQAQQAEGEAMGAMAMAEVEARCEEANARVEEGERVRARLWQELCEEREACSARVSQAEEAVIDVRALAGEQVRQEVERIEGEREEERERLLSELREARKGEREAMEGGEQARAALEEARGWVEEGKLQIENLEAEAAALRDKGWQVEREVAEREKVQQQLLEARGEVEAGKQALSAMWEAESRLKGALLEEQSRCAELGRREALKREEWRGEAAKAALGAKLELQTVCALFRDEMSSLEVEGGEGSQAVCAIERLQRELEAIKSEAQAQTSRGRKSLPPQRLLSTVMETRVLTQTERGGGESGFDNSASAAGLAIERGESMHLMSHPLADSSPRAASPTPSATSSTELLYAPERDSSAPPPPPPPFPPPNRAGAPPFHSAEGARAPSHPSVGRLSISGKSRPSMGRPSLGLGLTPPPGFSSSCEGGMHPSEQAATDAHSDVGAEGGRVMASSISSSLEQTRRRLAQRASMGGATEKERRPRTRACTAALHTMTPEMS